MDSTRIVFNRVRRLLGVTALDNSADALAFKNEMVTFYCVSGNIWLNPKITAVADTTAFKLVAGQSIDLNVVATLSIISDASGATYEYIVWEDM